MLHRPAQETAVGAGEADRLYCWAEALEQEADDLQQVVEAKKKVPNEKPAAE